MMETYAMTSEQITAYGANLHMEERCEATVQKYVSAVMALFRFLPPEKTVTREVLLAWKAEISARFSASGANVMISAVNRFCAFMSWSDIRIRQIKVQRRIFRDCERELTKAEYTRLLNAARAKGNLRLYWLMQTLASTGIRVSELRFVSVESLHNGRAVVDCKGKRRVIMIPQKLREKLLAYCAERGVKSGAVFVSRNGKPLSRSNIWKETALDGMEECPEYFGAFPPPETTPYGHLVRYKVLMNGVFWLQTDRLETALAAAYPVWDDVLSPYVMGRAQGDADGFGCLFFPKEAICFAVFELGRTYRAMRECPQIDAIALMNAVYRNFRTMF